MALVNEGNTMRWFSALIFSLFIFILPAQAANWKTIYYQPRNGYYYFDLDDYDIDLDNNTITYWEKFLPKGYVSKIDGKPIWYTIIRTYLDCETKRWGILSLYAYDRTGKLIGMHEGEGTTKPPPDTIRSELVNRMCQFTLDRIGEE